MELSRRQFLEALATGIGALALSGCGTEPGAHGAATQADAPQEMLVRKAYAIRTGDGIGIRPAATSMIAGVDTSSLENLTEDELANLTDEEFILLLSHPGVPTVPAYRLTSSDEAVAGVWNNGLVVGVSPGECTVEVVETDVASSSANLKVIADGERWSERDNLYRARLEACTLDAAPTGAVQVAGILKCAQNTRARIDSLLGAIVTSPVPWAADTSEHAISSLLATATAAEHLRDKSIERGLAALASEADAAQTTGELLSVCARWNSKGEVSLFHLTVGNDPAESESEDDIDLTKGIVVFNELCARLGGNLTQELLDEGPQTAGYGNLFVYVDLVLSQMGEPADLRAQTVPQVIETLARISVDRKALLRDEAATTENPDDVLYRVGGSPKTVALELMDTLYPHLRPASYLQEIGYSLTGRDFVEMQLPAQLAALDELVATGDASKLRELIKFTCGATYSHYTRAGFKAETVALETLEDATTSHDLAALDAAFDLMMGRDIVSDLLGWDLCAVYTQNFLQDPNYRVELKDLCERLKAEFVSTVDQCPWLSDTARLAFIDRLENLGIFVLGPEIYNDYVCSYALRSPGDGGTLFDNLRLIRQSDHNWRVANVGAELTPWIRMRGGQAIPPGKRKQAYPLDSAVVYDPSRNCVVVCAGVIDEATFMLQDVAGNLGRIGWLIAREISHAIDCSPAEETFAGSPSSVLSVPDRVHFEDVSARMARLFSNFCSWYDREAQSIYYEDGNITLKNCLADNAGMDVVLRIVARDVEATQRPQVLNLLAQSIADTQLDRTAATTGPFATPENRVNVAVSMFDEYYEISGTTERDAMFVNPAFRVCVWR